MGSAGSARAQNGKDWELIEDRLLVRLAANLGAADGHVAAEDRALISALLERSWRACRHRSRALDKAGAGVKHYLRTRAGARILDAIFALLARRRAAAQLEVRQNFRRWNAEKSAAWPDFRYR